MIVLIVVAKSLVTGLCLVMTYIVTKIIVSDPKLAGFDHYAYYGFSSYVAMSGIFFLLKFDPSKVDDVVDGVEELGLFGAAMAMTGVLFLLLRRQRH